MGLIESLFGNNMLTKDAKMVVDRARMEQDQKVAKVIGFGNRRS